MQLQSLAHTTNALHEITTVFADTTLDFSGQKAALTAISKAYTLETLKAAIAQSTLNQAQIEAILTANNLQGELLETTVNELVLAQAQKKVTASTLGFAADSIRSDFDSLSSTTDNIKRRYAELAQEVKNLGKVNQSQGTLSPVRQIWKCSQSVNGFESEGL